MNLQRAGVWKVGREKGAYATHPYHHISVFLFLFFCMYTIRPLSFYGAINTTACFKEKLSFCFVQLSLRSEGK